MDELVELNGQIEDLRAKRARLLAKQAVQEVRKVCPQAWLVLFDGPSEPGQGVEIVRVAASDGSDLFNLNTAEEDEVSEDDLVLAADYLSGALEDDESVFAQGLNQLFLLPISDQA